MSTYLKSLLKAIKYPVLIALGWVIAGFVAEMPGYADMSVGGLMILIYDIIKHRCGVKLP